jgi:hypothetical protein
MWTKNSKTLFLKFWRNVSPKREYIYINTDIYLCEIVRTKKGGKKVKAWQVETPKRWPASVD